MTGRPGEKGRNALSIQPSAAPRGRPHASRGAAARFATGSDVTDLAFALNHMVAPQLGLRDFMALAGRLGVGTVEIRNDLPGVAIADGTPPDEIRAAALEAGVSIASINALYPFNIWTAERVRQARDLIAAAAACGARGIVMCPLNDTAYAAPEAERLAALRDALTGLKPLLKEAGVVGLVEPLGFAECALRFKREAVEAIRDVGGEGSFALVHDTFHHHVAGETALFPAMTGLVHVSGVVDPAVGADRLRDPHRVLVDGRDLIDNAGQVRALLAGGYRGPVSFEPFAPEVHRHPDIEAALRDSMAYLAGAVARPAG